MLSLSPAVHIRVVAAPAAGPRGQETRSRAVADLGSSRSDREARLGVVVTAPNLAHPDRCSSLPSPLSFLPNKKAGKRAREQAMSEHIFNSVGQCDPKSFEESKSRRWGEGLKR